MIPLPQFLKASRKKLGCVLKFLILTAPFSAPLSHAVENENTDTETKPFRVFLGLGVGYGGVSSSEFSSAPTGVQFTLNPHLSYQIEHWDFEMGGGWFFSKLSGNLATGTPVSIITRAGMIDASPRYRIGEHWQVGPIATLLLGTDTSFSPIVGNSSASFFGGIKGVYEFKEKNFPIQLWAQVSTDITILNRQITFGLVGIQIGLPIGPGPTSETEEIKQTQAHPNLDLVTPPIRLAFEKVYFATNSFKIKPTTRKALRKFGAELKAHPASVKEVAISGFADQRGSFQYNLKLSRRRAETVLQAIHEGGAPLPLLKLYAFSFLKPVIMESNPKAWSENRRVEVKLIEPTPLP